MTHLVYKKKNFHIFIVYLCIYLISLNFRKVLIILSGKMERQCEKNVDILNFKNQIDP